MFHTLTKGMMKDAKWGEKKASFSIQLLARGELCRKAARQLPERRWQVPGLFKRLAGIWARGQSEPPLYPVPPHSDKE